jgi:NB-ARC domain/Domain of unknown function (DUF4062)
MPSVLISSTSEDLASYRKAAMDVCADLELLATAMEHFPAVGLGAVEGSLRKFAEGDVYVGIFAHRYGTIVPGHDRSVTELEFDFAGEQGLERLCFVVDGKYPWPPDAMDQRKEDRQRLKTFKARIDAELIRGVFTTVDDFARKLMHALVNWRDARGVDRDGDGLATRAPETAPTTQPPPPALVLGRSDDAARVKRRLIGAPDGRPGTTVIRGWPGVGKTTFVNALAHDSEVSTAFPDGILWASLGERPDPLAELSVWSRRLGGVTEAPKTLADAIRRVRGLLRERKALLIVDDVWESGAAAPFDVGGPGCATLVTTRFRDVASQVAPASEDVYLLQQLAEAPALELIGQLAPTFLEHHREEARRLVQELEGLPLALRVAARLLENEVQLGWGIDELFEEIAGGDRILSESAPEDRYDAATGELPTVSALLRTSTNRLDEQTRERFAILGAFAPKPATFDLGAMQDVWEVGDARPTARTLTDRGLLEPLIGTGRFQMHALLVKHAASLLRA